MRRRYPSYSKAIRRALVAGADPNMGMTRLARDGMLPGKLEYAYPRPDGSFDPVPRPYLRVFREHQP